MPTQPDDPGETSIAVAAESFGQLPQAVSGSMVFPAAAGTANQNVYISAGAPRAVPAGGQMASVVPSPFNGEDLKIPFSAFPEYARKRLEMFDENHDGRLADCVLQAQCDAVILPLCN